MADKAKGLKGRPTVAFAKMTWNRTQKPTVRAVSKILEDEGYDLPYRTLAQWRKDGWRAIRSSNGKAIPEMEPGAPLTHPEVNAFASIVAKQEAAGALNRAINGTAENVQVVRDALADMSAPELIDEAIRQFSASLIMVAKTAREKVDFLVGVLPRDYAALIQAHSAALKEVHDLIGTGTNLVPVSGTGSDGKPMNGELIVPEKANPLAAVARKYGQAAEKVPA